jgi:hypothetical protein
MNLGDNSAIDEGLRLLAISDRRKVLVTNPIGDSSLAV